MLVLSFYTFTPLLPLMSNMVANIRVYNIQPINAMIVHKDSFALPYVKEGMNNIANNGNAIDIAVPEPKTISSATGVSKLGSTPFNKANPVEATPVSIPNNPIKY